VNVDQIFPFIFGAVFLAIVVTMARGFFAHGGFKGMMFGAGIRRTVGEVEGAGKSMMKTALKVHVLDGSPDRAIGLEFVAKSVASYQMLPISLSASEARRLVAHLQTALGVR
jgi:hypothetical protein